LKENLEVESVFRMAPKRKELTLQSVWDESLLTPVVSQSKFRVKLWRHLINSLADSTYQRNYKRRSTKLEDVPFSEWNFPKVSADKIKSDFQIFTTTISEKSESARGDTTKLLVRLQDGHQVETVVMKHRGHATVCISSQIGCQMGCRFCATGTMGIIGDLTAGEIIEQLVHANAVTQIRNVVFMGMGEPLNNYENVKRAVSFMVDNKLFALCKFVLVY
jgi:adenine C2-methylase RlmN of 23S rRNA A2503 and tRNA A37